MKCVPFPPTLPYLSPLPTPKTYLTGRHSHTAGAGPTHNCKAERYKQHTGDVTLLVSPKYMYTTCNMHDTRCLYLKDLRCGTTTAVYCTKPPRAAHLLSLSTTRRLCSIFSRMLLKYSCSCTDVYMYQEHIGSE